MQIRIRGIKDLASFLRSTSNKTSIRYLFQPKFTYGNDETKEYMVEVIQEWHDDTYYIQIDNPKEIQLPAMSLVSADSTAEFMGSIQGYAFQISVDSYQAEKPDDERYYSITLIDKFNGMDAKVCEWDYSYDEEEVEFDEDFEQELPPELKEGNEDENND